MKTEKDLKKEIEDNRKSMFDKNITKRQYNRYLKINDQLHVFLMYLETKPNEIFLEQEKERISNLIISKESQFKNWSASVCPDNIEPKNRRQLFNRELGLTHLKNQLKTINYLLT